MDVPHVVLWREKLVQVLHRALELIGEEAFARLLLSFLRRVHGERWITSVWEVRSDGWGVRGDGWRVRGDG